ncbi:MAG: phosphoribosylglycinamide formyltransferase [Nitrospinae bacterium]|nr:phosphoribosylglycinamide formyltransferase [Nitrospinota bacterium]MZH05431.1 phosphoribosylglycinamide formyltransferase [Nitrospinota bacterium]MZH13291.1 phosphoribosylglycinamide formyltransferase [Nitrospinota bacterium]
MSSEKFKLAVLVSGRGSNLQAIIDSIEKNNLAAEISLVLSNVKDAYALERGKKHGLEVVFLDPKVFPGKADYEQQMIDLLQSKSVDLVCLAGFMRILGEKFIEAFSGKIINIHPSLLPAFPGLNVQKKALEHGAKFSGCTVHFVNEEVDGGPIIKQAVVPIHDEDSIDSLSERILEQEHIIYPEAIRLIIEDKIKVSGRRVLQKA